MNSVDIVKGFNNDSILFNDNLIINLENDKQLFINLIENVNNVNVNVSNDSDVKLYVTSNLNNNKINYNLNVDKNSKIEIVFVQRNSNENVFTTNLNTNSICNMFFIDLSDNSCNEFNTNLNDDYAEFNLKTASVNLADSQSKFIIDTKHLSKATYSTAISRSVVLDNGKYVNSTTGFIEKGCSFSKCHQDTKAIVLGANATAECDPVLLIDEYDVEASHAAAVGKINEDELYYLQSRGLNFEQCLALLVNGFLISVTNDISDEEFKESVVNEVVELLNV